MAKKSFGTQLVQGFFRSAVNQVGRDGGKVVSNKVYKDQHSTPIRGVNSQNRFVKQEEFNPKLFSNPIWLYPVMFIGSLIISPIGVIYHLFSAIKYALMYKSLIREQDKSVFLIKSMGHLLLAGFFSWIVYQIYQAFQQV